MQVPIASHDKNQILHQSCLAFPAPINPCKLLLSISSVHPHAEALKVGNEGACWSCCVSPILHLFLQPELFVLFAPKALIIVAFALEKLLEVWLAVEFPMESCITAQA